MVSLVGTQTNYADALRALIELDYDAVEAYEAAINRVNDEMYKSTLTKFKNDHQNHIEKLSELLRDHGEAVPQGPSSKQWITKGKVVLANLIGDKAILMAMRSNEIDTNTAYERVYMHDSRWPDSIEIIQKGLEDERRHKAWLESKTA